MKKAGKENREQSSNSWVAVDIRPEVRPFTPEWVMLSFLRGWTAEDLAAAVERNIEIDLSPFMGYVEDAITQHILQWFKMHRPDLHAVLASNAGTAWLKRNIGRILRGR